MSKMPVKDEGRGRASRRYSVDLTPRKERRNRGRDWAGLAKGCSTEALSECMTASVQKGPLGRRVVSWAGGRGSSLSGMRSHWLGQGGSPRTGYPGYESCRRTEDGCSEGCPPAPSSQLGGLGVPLLQHLFHPQENA